MEFFTAPPPLEREPFEERALPAWVGPPTGILGAISPIERMLFEGDALVIALVSGTVFPEGVKIAVQIGARRTEGMDEDTWRTRHELLMHGNHHPFARHGASLDDEVLRFGVRFSDGSKATTVDRRAESGGEWPPPRPDGPILQYSGGGGSSRNNNDFASSGWSMWLWPLPPPEPFEFAVEWPAFGVPLIFTEIDGAPINAAAARARPFWP
ncbi:hypothetical protein [Sphaerisporangium aureirubrum]|uniref:Uncharacterized protein n=1 Tax=Sphaerisporangium aureirubrum TaxID=1544736 RepID=A0ABW1NE89_9ACTN